jgi:diketogulonate reductase-like aldo/keto reductase
MHKNQDSEVPQILLNDGNYMPAIGLGILGTDDIEAKKIVMDAISVGYRMFDTASLYGNEIGVGSGVEASEIPRSDLFVITKLHEDIDSYDSTLKAFDLSMKKLGLDYLDLYLIHWPQPKIGKYPEIWKAFEEIKKSGRVKSIGVSNFTEEQLTILSNESSVIPCVNQVELHPSFQQSNLRKFNRKLGIVTQAWSPIGGQGQFKSLLDVYIGPDDKNPVLIGLGKKHNLTPAKMRKFLEDLPVGTVLNNETLAGIGKKHGRSVAQIVLRWHIEIGVVPLPKTSKVNRLAENIDVFNFSLDAEDRLAISKLETGLRTGFDPELFN